MHGSAEEKVPGGKLLRIKVDFNGAIKDIQISGDFFLHPEECIDKIEKNLFGISIGMEENQITHLIEEISKSNKIEMIGISAKDIARVLKRAIANAK